MINKRRLREIVALLEQHRLDAALAVLKKKSGDFNVILDVLLRSYSETRDESFFSHFYALTVPIIVSDVRRFLDEEGMSADPQEFITDIYETVLRFEDNGNAGREESILYHCSAIAGHVVRYSKERSSAEDGEHFQDLPPVAERVLVGLPVPAEEERRAGLLVARIREIVFGGHLELSAREEEILGHFYRAGLALSEVAAVMETDLQEISDTLFSVRKRVQSMIVPSNGTSTSGELNR